MSRLPSIAILLVLGILFSTGTAWAQDQKAEKKKKKQAESSEIVGTIKSISGDGKLLTIEVPATGKKAKKLPPTTRQVLITEQTKIEFAGVLPNGEKALKPGNSITVSVAQSNIVPAGSIKVSTDTPAKKKKKKDKAGV